MSKLTREQTKRLISERNTEDMKRAFHEKRNNGHEINKLWDKIALCLEGNFKGSELKTKYNDLLKHFRKKKLEAGKSGAKAVTWEYFQDFIDVEAAGTELVAPACLDSAKSDPPISDDYSEENTSDISISPPKKRKHVPAIEKAISFLKEDSERKINFFEKIFNNQSIDYTTNLRLEKLEKMNEQILELLLKNNKKSESGSEENDQ